MTLEVRLYQEPIGWLQQDGSAIVSLVLTDAYAEAHERPVLGQFFEDHRDWRVFRMSKHPGRLPAFFSNLLPEGGLREIVAGQASDRDELSIVKFVGTDLPGAVTVHEASGGSKISSPSARSVLEEAGSRAEEAQSEWRFSLAGVQLKFSAVESRDGRFTLPFRGDTGRWILKFSSPAHPGLVENEFATMNWARLCGISLPVHRLVPVAELCGMDPRFLALGPSVFAIERYDRSPTGERIHQEDFAQVRCLLPEFKYGGASYEGLARFVADQCGPQDLNEFVRRLVFLVLAGNTDAHLKNWSLVYPEPRKARLAPAYDLVFVREYMPNDKLALPLANEHVPERISWDHVRRLEKFLRKHGHDVAVADAARDFAATAMRVWREHGELGSAEYRRRMERHLSSLPLAEL